MKIKNIYIALALSLAILVGWRIIGNSYYAHSHDRDNGEKPTSTTHHKAELASQPTPIAQTGGGSDFRSKPALQGPVTLPPYVGILSGPSYSRDIYSLLEIHKEIALSRDDQLKLQAIYDIYQKDRLRIEASIAEVTAIDAARVSIKIPAYEEAGDEIREGFLEEVGRKLGSDASQTLRTAAWDFLDQRFKGFGRGVQEIEVSYNKDSKTYTIIHTTSIPSAENGAYDETTTSRLKPTNLDVYANLSAKLPNPTQ